MSQLQRFYDRYHQQNSYYHKVIDRWNFTYFYSLGFLHSACPQFTLTQGKILDVGCGVGALSLYLAQLGAQVTGVDISPRAISIARSAAAKAGLTNVHFQVGEIKPGKATYDLVICSEILEHIADESVFLHAVRSQLKKQGHLFLTTPSQENTLFSQGYYQEFDQRVGHLRRYTPATIRHLLAAHGFKVIELRVVEGPLRNILFTSKLGFLIKFIRGPLVPVFHFLDSFSAQLGGAADIQVLAIKK